MTGVKENRELRVLSAIGIILVVSGHLGYNLFDIGGLFPYYSFHVFLFLFVSGYFYKREEEEQILSYILKSAGRCFCRIFYGIYFTGSLRRCCIRQGFPLVATFP